MERESVSSFHDFARQLLFALSKKPSAISDLKEAADLNRLKYEEGWIARASEYLEEKRLINVNKSRRHYQSGADDDYHAVITGVGLAEVEKLEEHSRKISDTPPLKADAGIGNRTTRNRIFLAHAREDKPQVCKLYADLKARGFDPWLDEKDLRAGQIWKVEIPKAIREASLFLACLSSRSVNKAGYVQSEFREALAAFGERPAGSIFLIPVRLDDCDVPDLQIPKQGLSLRDFHWIDLWQDDGFDRLVSDLEHALGVSPSSPQVVPEGRPTAMRSPEATEVAKVFRDIDAPWCPELVVIPPGEFLMGSPSDEEDRFDEEGPQHEVQIAYRFAAGRYPVTFDEYDRFAQATAREPPPDEGWGRGRRPVINVSWDDAKAYVEWLSKETGEPYRLLSEAEWEYACRAGTTTRYWWGDDEPTAERANFGHKVGKNSEVGSYPPSPWGLYDMHGNVWEWCEDCWNDSYKGAPSDGSVWTSGDHGRRVLRGGSWVYDPRYLRSAFRGGDYSDYRSNDIGFRVARTLR